MALPYDNKIECFCNYTRKELVVLLISLLFRSSLTQTENNRKYGGFSGRHKTIKTICIRTEHFSQRSNIFIVFCVQYERNETSLCTVCVILVGRLFTKPYRSLSARKVFLPIVYRIFHPPLPPVLSRLPLLNP